LREFIENNALDLRSKGLSTCSPKLWAFSNLVSVDFSQNTLKILPEEIYYLRNLKKLRMCATGLHTLPKNLLKLKELVHLELNQNALCSFYEGAQKHEVELDRLSYLSLNSNGLV